MEEDIYQDKDNQEEKDDNKEEKWGFTDLGTLPLDILVTHHPLDLILLNY